MEKAYFNKIRKELILALLSSEANIQIAVAWFTNKELFDTLIYLLKDGVTITLVIIDDFINNGEFGLDFQQFIDSGGKLFYGKEENPMHHKFCIIDNKILFTGSYNWTYYAENKNFENVVKFENSKDLIKSFHEEFEKLITDLEIVNVANKISLEEFEIKNLFSIRNYIAMDLTFKGKELKKIEFVERAKRFIDNSELINKEYAILKTAPLALITKEISPFQSEIIMTTKIRKIAQNSIGIKCRINGIDGKFSILIPKETECPCSFSHIFRTVYDNQTRMSIETFKGENEIADKNVRLGKFLINDLPKKPNGEAGVEITIKLNSNSDLIVVAKSVDTGNQMEANYYDKSLVGEETSL